MLHLKRSPEFENIASVLAIALLRDDGAIAQNAVQQQPQPLPQPQINTFDPVSILGYGALGLTALWGVGSQLIAKAGAAVISAKEKKANQELSQDAAINNGYVRQADKSFEALSRLLDTMMVNVLQSSRESKEIFYLGHEKTKENTEAIAKLEESVSARLTVLEDNLATIMTAVRDISNVLKMKVRDGT